VGAPTIVIAVSLMSRPFARRCGRSVNRRRRAGDTETNPTGTGRRRAARRTRTEC
jgi:hypothetical protein